MVTTDLKHIIDTHNFKQNKSNHNTKGNHQKTREEYMRGRKDKGGTTKTASK